MFTSVKQGTDIVVAEADELECVSLRPYTFAHLRYKGFDGFGFAKVNHPDEWNATQGRVIARRRAARRIAKAILKLTI